MQDEVRVGWGLFWYSVLGLASTTCLSIPKSLACFQIKFVKKKIFFHSFLLKNLLMHIYAPLVGTKLSGDNIGLQVVRSDILIIIPCLVMLGRITEDKAKWLQCNFVLGKVQSGWYLLADIKQRKSKLIWAKALWLQHRMLSNEVWHYIIIPYLESPVCITGGKS